MKVFINIFTILAVCYGAGAFISADINPAHWHPFMRAMCVLAAFSMGIAGITNKPRKW